jgi:hypothetical protein
MAASQADINAVKIGVAIPEGTEAAFTDALFQGFIEAHPVKDASGLKPADLGWTETYDLMAATADVWGLIAAYSSQLYDFVADGATFSRSQLFDHALRMAAFFNSRRRARTVTIQRDRQRDILYQGRWPFTAEYDLNAYQQAEGEIYAPNTTQGQAL